MAQDAAQDTRWVGCYEVDRGGWTWTWTHEDSTQFEPPEFIRLGTETTDSRYAANRWLVEPAIVSYRPAPGFWEAVGEDSLSIVWSSGFTGPVMRLAASGDSLLGTVRAFSDDGTAVPAPSAPVVSHPTTCENGAVRPGRE